MSKWPIFRASVICIVLLTVTYLIAWHRWKSGVIVAEGNIEGGSKIRVRQLPQHAPLWALPFKGVGDYNLYRCEFYDRFNDELLWSSETYSDRGYRVNNVEIKSTGSNGVTVWFNGVAPLKCDPNGLWEPTR